LVPEAAAPASTHAVDSWLAAEPLWAAALDATGLRGRLAPVPDEGLPQLCASLNRQAPDLSFLGKQRIRNSLMQALQWRLRLEEAMTACPEVQQTAITRPILICGPFRSGTTYLHRLMAEDAQFRWIYPWQSLYAPRDEPLRAGIDAPQQRDPRIEILRRDLQNLYRRNSKLLRLHPVDVEKAEECFGFLESSALSPSFMFHAPVSEYLDWLAAVGETGWMNAYRRYRDHLRLLAWQQQDERRWLLKSPVHLWNVAAFRAAFPDALVVYTHREPFEAVHSLCRLLAAHYEVSRHRVDPQEVGRIAMQFYRAALPRAVASRHADANQASIDVQLVDLRRDPVVIVRAVYEAAGLTLSDQARRRIELRLEEKEGSHSGERDSDADTFGLNIDRIRELFAEYDSFH
jgi:hypothetical protein